MCSLRKFYVGKDLRYVYVLYLVLRADEGLRLYIQYTYVVFILYTYTYVYI